MCVKIKEFLTDPNCKLILTSYIKSLCIVMLVAFGFVLFKKVTNWYGVLAFIFGATGIGTYNIPTWGGTSRAEKLREWLQMLFSLLALIFGLLSISPN